MDGITILSQSIAYDKSSTFIIIAAILILSALLIFTISTLIDGKNKVSVILIISMIFTVIGLKYMDRTNVLIKEPLYKVTMSDVNLNEFNEKYIIIKQDNNIFTIKEK